MSSNTQSTLRGLSGESMHSMLTEMGVDVSGLEESVAKFTTDCAEVHKQSRQAMGEEDGSATYWLARDLVLQSSIRYGRQLSAEEADTLYTKVAMIASEIAAVQHNTVGPYLEKIQSEVDKNPSKYFSEKT